MIKKNSERAKETGAESLYNRENGTASERSADMKKRFICATREICDFSHRIPAPYLRRAFDLDFAPERAAVSVCGLGFYRLWVNG